MPRPKKAILLRIPAELAERLNQWAQHELRSVNAQIEYVLREAVRKRFGPQSLPEGAAPDDEPEPEAGSDRPA